MVYKGEADQEMRVKHAGIHIKQALALDTHLWEEAANDRNTKAQERCLECRRGAGT